MSAEPGSGSLGPLASLLYRLNLDVHELDCLAPLVEPAPAEPVFTVIVRTQGRRPRSLREAVGSLAAQTWKRFETVVAVHGDAAGAVPSAADPAAVPSGAARATGDDAVEAALRDAAAAGRAPADWKVLRVAGGGTRSRPLNAGLDAAVGDYATFLDDDDLVEPDWLAVFARGAAEAPGQVIRARSARQPWTTSGTAEPRRPAGPVDHVYPATFDLLGHFAYSETPICSLALPRRALSHFGLRFDETLEVCEDWDMLMRSALLLGVHSMDETTSLYRRCDNANSQTQVDWHGWDRDRARVIDKLASQPFVLDGASARRLADAYFEYDGRPAARVERIRTKALLAALPKRMLSRLSQSLRLPGRVSGAEREP